MRCSAKKRGRAIRADHESKLTGFGSTAINAMLCEKMVLLARCEILEKRRASSTAIKAARFRAGLTKPACVTSTFQNIDNSYKFRTRGEGSCLEPCPPRHAWRRTWKKISECEHIRSIPPCLSPPSFTRSVKDATCERWGG